jgi:lambda repressor-like predicted transcriptional regulator
MTDPRAHKAAYARTMRRLKANGWDPFAPAEPIRAHVATLRKSGLGRRSIAAAAGVNESTIRRISSGAPRVYRRVAELILAVPAYDVVLVAETVAAALYRGGPGEYRPTLYLDRIGNEHDQAEICRRLAAGGLSPSTIASRLRANPARVRNIIADRSVAA